MNWDPKRALGIIAFVARQRPRTLLDIADGTAVPLTCVRRAIRRLEHDYSVVVTLERGRYRVSSWGMFSRKAVLDASNAD